MCSFVTGAAWQPGRVTSSLRYTSGNRMEVSLPLLVGYCDLLFLFPKLNCYRFEVRHHHNPVSPTMICLNPCSTLLTIIKNIEFVIMSFGTSTFRHLDISVQRLSIELIYTKIEYLLQLKHFQ